MISIKAYALQVGAGLALATVAVLPVSASAEDGKIVKAPVVDATAPSDESNQMVTRDAQTGQLRAATHDEARALRATTSLRIAPARTMPKVHHSGAQGARLTDEFMSYSVVVRQADGKLAEVCFSSREEAEAALTAQPSKSNNAAPTE